MKVAARIRRVYLDAMKRGEKDYEVRRQSLYWISVADRLLEAHHHVEGSPAGTRYEFVAPLPDFVFICGKDVLRRPITDLTLNLTPELALGRAPSVQGAKDIGPGFVMRFDFIPIVSGARP